MKIRISMGQSVCGGSIDAHQRSSDGALYGQWGVSGYLEFPDTPEGWAQAQALADTAPEAYPYRVGEWAPPPGATRFSEYGPRD